MRAADPRLLQHARAARGHLVVAVGLGLAVTGLILAQAALRAAARVKSQLRRKLIRHSLRLGPAWLGGQPPPASPRGRPYQRMWEDDYEPAC